PFDEQVIVGLRLGGDSAPARGRENGRRARSVMKKWASHPGEGECRGPAAASSPSPARAATSGGLLDRDLELRGGRRARLGRGRGHGDVVITEGSVLVSRNGDLLILVTGRDDPVRRGDLHALWVVAEAQLDVLVEVLAPADADVNRLRLALGDGGGQRR